MGKNVELGHAPRHHQHPRRRAGRHRGRRQLPPGEVCVISTGSQGEPMSALSLMATGENKWLRIGEDDVVVISAHPIPGNEWSVGQVIDDLHRRGAEVVHSGAEAVHVSGHARQGELRTLIVGDRAGVLRARARRVPPHGAPRPPGPLHGHRPGQGAPVRGRRRDPARRQGHRPRRPGAGGLRLRRRHGGRHRARRAARPQEAGRGGRGHGRGHGRPPAEQAQLPAGDRDPGLGLRARGRGAARRRPARWSRRR